MSDAQRASGRQAETSLPASRQQLRAGRRARTLRTISRGWQLYLMLALPVLYLIVFQYWPMYGVQIAFRSFNVVSGITGVHGFGLKLRAVCDFI